MGDIATTKIEKTITALFKERITFCLVMDACVYLRSDEEQEHIVFQGKKYAKTHISLANCDNFLRAATESYWVACGN